MLRIRRTTSLSISTPKARAICCAILGHPQLGFRRFISSSASMSSLVGPFGPGRRPRLRENSKRYFPLISSCCRCSRVEGLRTMAERRSRARRMKSVHTPAMKRSAACKLGARLRPRFRMSSCCRTSTDSASTLRGPPGFASRKTVTMKWTTRTRKSLISGNRTRAPQMLDSGRVQEFAMNTFLHNHVGQMVSMDFFTVPTITMKVLFVFIVLEHRRREVLHFNVTEHPSAAWTSQQIVEAFANQNPPRYLLRDRDRIYGNEVRLRIASLQMEEVLTAPRSPRQNPYAERLIARSAGTAWTIS